MLLGSHHDDYFICGVASGVTDHRSCKQSFYLS